MARITITSRYGWLACLGVIVAAGCGGAPGKQHEGARVQAYADNGEALKALEAHDYPTAEAKFTAAIDSRVLNPDIYCQAVARRAVCRAAAGKYPEALADLDQLGPSAGNPDEVFAARAFILAKQGKVAESRAALAQARRINRFVKEFK